MRFLLHCIALFGVAFSYISAATISDCVGCITLDQQSFNKMRNKFEVLVVKFDSPFPYGDKHNAYINVAGALKDKPNIMFSEVGVKYYGKYQNMEFAKLFNMNAEDELPSVRIFLKGQDEPYVYDNKQLWNEEDIQQFLRERAQKFVGLPGCLVMFDRLATEFSETDDKQPILEEAQQLAKTIKDKEEKKSAETYLRFMVKIIESESFILEEKQRLQKLLSTAKLSEKKKQEIYYKYNIIQSFTAMKTEL